VLLGSLSVPCSGRKVDTEALRDIGAQAREAVAFARTVGAVSWADDARELWIEVYPALSEGKPGMFGLVTARAEAQTIRLALLIAVLDKSGKIRLDHLRAALALWRYCADSAAYIFGQLLGDPVADQIVKMLRTQPGGATRTELNKYFDGNKDKAQLDHALTLGQSAGLIRMEKRETGGRAAEVWHLVSVF
jgi:hypothetical protein